MIDRNDEILADFLAEAEDYNGIVQEGLRTIESGSVALGIEAIFRPIHTIKGASGFLGGLEKLSGYTHKVEDLLRAVQNHDVPAGAKVADLLVRSVDQVFAMIDQIANGADELDDSEARNIEAEIHKLMSPQSADGEGVEIDRREGVVILTVNLHRIHLPGHFKMLTNLLKNLEAETEILIDLSAVRTIGSTAWGQIWRAGEDKAVTVTGLNESSKTVFFRWEFDRHINYFDTREDFWRARAQSPVGEPGTVQPTTGAPAGARRAEA